MWLTGDYGLLVHSIQVHCAIHCNRLQGTYRETGEHMEKLFHLQGIPVPWTGSWLFSILWYREWLLELQGMTVGGTGGLQGNKWTQGKTVSPTGNMFAVWHVKNHGKTRDIFMLQPWHFVSEKVHQLKKWQFEYSRKQKENSSAAAKNFLANKIN